MRRERLIKRKKFRKSIWIICDGDTEKYYLQSMKRELNTQNNAIKIDKLSGKSEAFEKVFEAIEKELYIKEDDIAYDLIFYVRDMDACYKQNKIAEYNLGKSKLMKMDLAKGRLFFIESRPCIEFWFLLHFLKTDNLYEFCSKAISALCGYLPDYEKNESCSKRIYEQLRPYLDKALANAKELNAKKRLQRQGYSYSKMDELYHKLKSI